jgi:predicted TPR repeat methyltransferase
MARGETRVKRGGPGSYEAASEEMEQAVLAAPWLADGYYNLGVIQEKAGKFSEATHNFRLYLLAAPRSRNATPVQVKIYELERMKKEKEKDQ